MRASDFLDAPDKPSASSFLDAPDEAPAAAPEPIRTPPASLLYGEQPVEVQNASRETARQNAFENVGLPAAAPSVSPPPDRTVDTTRDRPRSAASSFVQGGLDVIAAVPKSAEILGSAIQRNVFQRQGIPERYASDPREGSAYALGEDIEEFSKETFPTNPAFKDEFLTETLPRGAGSTLGFAATGVAGRAMGAGALLTASGTGAATQAASQFEDALNHGAELGDAFTASGYGAAVGTSEGLPIAHLLERLDKGTGGFVRRAISNALIQGTEEAAQEAFQTISDNLIASKIVEYDPNRGVFTGTGEAAGTGFSVGGLMGFLGGLLTGRRARQDQPVPQEQVEPTIAPPGDPAQQPAPAVEQPLPQPLPEPETEAPPVPSRRGELETILEDPRPVEEIAAERQQQAQQRAVEAAQAAGYPEAGTRITVTAPGEEPIAGVFEEAFELPSASGPIQGVRVRGDDGNVYEFEAGDAEISVADGTGEKTSPIKAETAQDIEIAAEQVNTTPTEGQKEAGNYKKAHLKLQGIDIALENPKGSERTGIGADGKPWSTTMPGHYGYVKRTEGADGDQVDVYIGEQPESQQVFAVDQIDPATGKFDEHKFILGTGNEQEARALYEGGFSDGSGPSRAGAVTPLSIEEFKTYLAKGDTKKPLAYQESVAEDAATDRAVGDSQGAAPSDGVSPPVESGAASNIETHLSKARDYALKGKKRLTVPQIAEALGVTPDEARAILNRMVAEKTIRKTKKGYSRVPTEGPADILRALAGRGIRDDEGHNLLQGRNAQRFIPGKGPLVRADGMGIDEAGEMLWESGYFGHPGSTSRPSTAEVLEMIDRALAGQKIFSFDDIAEIQEREVKAQEAEQKRQLDEAKRDIEAVATEIGETLKPEEVTALAEEMLRTDGTAEEVLVDFAERQAIEAESLVENLPDEVETASEEIPFDDAESGTRRTDDTPAERAEEARPVDEGQGQGAAGNTVAKEDRGVPADRGEQPASASERTPEGEQSLIPGVSPVTDRDRAEVKAEAPLRSQKAQKPADEGLFDTGARKQTDLLDAIAEAEKPPATKTETPTPQPAQEAGSSSEDEGPAKPSDLSSERGVSAYSGTSFSPERRAATDIEGYVEDVNGLRDELLKKANTPEQRSIAEAQVARYREGYIKRQNALWDAKGRTLSPMITGPAKFPTRRNEKALGVERKRIDEFLDWRKRARAAAHKAVYGARSTEQVASDDWDALKKDIDDNIATVRGIDARELPYSRPAFTNSIAGKLRRLAANGEAELVKRALDYIAEEQKSSKKPFFAKNNSIWQLGEQADQEAARERPTGEETISEGNGVRIVNDHDAERVRIYFPGKPDQETITNLKKEGWRWSRQAGAWQRKNTNAAASSAKRIVGKIDKGDLGPSLAARSKPTAKYKAVQDEVVREIRDLVRQIAPNIRKVRAVAGKGKLGEYGLGSGDSARYFLDRDMAVFALDKPDMQGLVRHEVVHHLRNMQMFTDREWGLLRKEAEGAWLDFFDIETTYAGYLDVFGDEQGREFQIEEAVAHAYPAWEKGDLKIRNQNVVRIFNRLKRFFERLRNLLNGHGFQTVEDIFERIESGEVGRRTPGEPLGLDRSLAARKPLQRQAKQGGLFGMSFQYSTPAVRDYLTNKNLSLVGRLYGAAKVAGKTGRFLFQDKYIDLQDIQAAIQKAKGVDVLPEGMDAYLAEELHHGTTGKQLDDFQQEMVEPLIEAINESGLMLEELELYLYARHAEERNNQIASINPDMPDGGSGMSTAEAQEILGDIKKSNMRPILEDLARRVDQMNQKRLDILVDGDLIDEFTRQRWLDTYDHYVPLRGFEASNDEGDTTRARTGKGFDIRGQESKRAMGRESAAGSILAYVITQYEEAVVRAEKNKVGKTFLNLVQNNPHPDIWEINERKLMRRIDKQTGLVEYIPDPMASRKDNVMAVKVGGKVQHITIHHARLADAMKNLGAESMNGLLRTLQTLNRYLAIINTSGVPEFVFSNFARDLTTAGINMQQFDEKGLTSAVMRDVPRALRGAYQGIRHGHKDAEWARHFDEFAKAGGKIEFFSLDDIEQKKKRLASLLKDANAGNLRSAAVVTKKIFRLVQDINGAVENGVRLSLYVNLRRRGVTPKRAASAARNLTVNFNRKGEWGAAASAMYLFYNASIQGTAVMMKALGHKNVRRAVYGIVLAGLATDLVNGMISPEDDDKEKKYDKIGQWTQDHNIIIMNPWAGDELSLEDQVAFKWPLPYGYNVFWAFGTKVGKVIRGKKDPIDAAIELSSIAVNSFNPMGGEAEITKALTPTVLKPAFELQVNENFAGNPIMPEQAPYGPPKPDSQRYWNSVSGPSKAISAQLNRLTGGNEIRPGAIDVSPETLDHWWDFATGGVGKFGQRVVVDPITKWAEGADFEWNDIPFARRLIQGNNQYFERAQYRKVRDAAKLYEKEQKAFIAAKDFESAKAAREKYATDAKMLGIVKRSEKEMRKLYKERNAVEATKGLSAAAKRARLERVDDKLSTVRTRVLRRYNELKEKEGKDK